ncbi:NAD-dependent epimerase/dehydratase family protein [Myxococcota bacterium]|nr:NAD-dependent epimerase/dehydratase family protein [Myxococcota bacterium]
MSLAIVTGSAGLIGAESCRYLDEQGLEIVGVDNDMRRTFFGDEASTDWSRKQLERNLHRYRHESLDIRDESGIDALFARYGRDISLIVHTAAQPSHDWAAREPKTDFTVNANGTLNLLEATRNYSPDAVFIFTSTNKVYGDTPNQLPLVEQETRWELPDSHPYGPHGIDETMSLDSSMHSLFGVSKVASDLMVQEYGRYFGLHTGTFRGGCLTGPGHSGAQLHGFLAYLVKCAVDDTPYTVIGYGGKQVRDNLHSRDLVRAFWHFFQSPRAGEVYNMGGARHSNCSMREAITMAEQLTGRPMRWSYEEQNRAGDHIWWISDVRKFQAHFPDWRHEYDVEAILREIYEELQTRDS